MHFAIRRRGQPCKILILIVQGIHFSKSSLPAAKTQILLWTLTPRRLRPTREANKTQTRDPLNFGPCKADWPAAFVIK